MTQNIAVFGGSFNPPGQHHRNIAAALAGQFDQVIVVPCGPRPDKPVTGDVASVHRAAMADINFRGLKNVRVELFDLEASTFTRTHELESHFAAEGAVWHVVGADLVAGGHAGRSIIQRQWMNGEALWRNSQFVCVRRPGVDLDPSDLPPHSRLIDVRMEGSSSSIRSQVFHRESVDGVLVPSVAAYIERHGLYRGMPARGPARFEISAPRFMVVCDEKNAKAQQLHAELSAYDSSEPELIVVIGGDGTMLRAIRQHWRRRVPFYGVNAGHLGFLLNEESPLASLTSELVLGHVPLLYVETESPEGVRNSAVAFNDTWVERATGQTAWIRVSVNGQERLPLLVADGALVATAAGSTSYARAMGATALPLNTPALLLVGSNVLKPPFWRPVVLPLDSTVELATLDPVKRPLQGYIDGVSQGMVRVLKARVSHIAAAELVFAPQHDPAAKLARIQFPGLGE